MTKAYVLIYDTDNGSREDCNIFYSPIEVFADAETRAKRMDFIDTNAGYDIGYRTEDIELMTIHDFDIPENLLPYNDDDEAEEYTVVEHKDYDSSNPADYYFYAFEALDPWDFKDKAQMLTFVNVVPAKFFDDEKCMYDQSISAEFGDRFSETMECEYEFEGTPEEARAEMLALGARENAEFSQMIQRYVDEYNG